jgi:plasmid stabilization system protein ParE
MPRGDKSSYTDKQKRQAEHIEAGYKAQGLSDATAERRAWATVNKQDGGGKKSGSGRKAVAKKAAAKKSTGRKTTAAAKNRPAKKALAKKGGK